MQYELRLVEFDDVLPVWQNKLWPGRQSPIKPMSSMTLDRQYDMSIYDNYEPFFWAVYHNNEIVAVNSGHQTNATEFRSRGLYADPAHRGKGLAKMLLNELLICAEAVGCNLVWTVPRKGSEHAYLSAGFVLYGGWFNEGMEFGPNIYSICYI